MNGHASHGADSSYVLDIPVRDKKGAAKRVFQEDLALYLVGTTVNEYTG